MKPHSDKCPSCGKQHVPGFAFCQRCGVPLGSDLDSETAAMYRRSVADSDEPESSDLNGRLIALVERGRWSEAVQLYHEALGCSSIEAEAAVRELAKNVEFAVVDQAAPRGVINGRTNLFIRCLAAVRSVIGLNNHQPPLR